MNEYYTGISTGKINRAVEFMDNIGRNYEEVYDKLNEGLYQYSSYINKMKIFPEADRDKYFKRIQNFIENLYFRNNEWVLYDKYKVADDY